MSENLRSLLLRANAVFLLVASAGGMAADLLGAFYGMGPQASVVALAPNSTIGFVEAHGLAFIIGIRLWLAPPLRIWHFTAAAVHVLLGTANLLFWQLFVSADMLAVGYVSTILHAGFAGLQLFAALSSGQHSPS